MPRLRAKSGHHGPQPQEGSGDDHGRQRGQRHDVAVGDGHDAPEEVGRQVARGVARAQAHEQRPDGHADGPDDADGRVLADAPPAAGPFDAQRREDGEYQRPDDRVRPQIEGDAQSAERGVGDASGEEDHAAADDIGSYDSARYARKHTRRECVREIAVLDQVAEKFHIFPRANLSPVYQRYTVDRRRRDSFALFNCAQIYAFLSEKPPPFAQFS